MGPLSSRIISECWVSGLSDQWRETFSGELVEGVMGWTGLVSVRASGARASRLSPEMNSAVSLQPVRLQDIKASENMEKGSMLNNWLE